MQVDRPERSDSGNGAGDAVTNGDGTQVPGPWQLDALPLLISAADWDTLESGLVQRSRVMDAVLTDLYADRRSITSGVLPPQLVFSHPGYLRAARGIAVPGRHQLFLHGVDVSRDASGEFLVNADWTQAPSGAGYALADRQSRRARIPGALRTHRPATGVTMGAGAAAGPHRRRPGIGGGTRRGGPQSRYSLRDRIRPGLPGQRARLPAGGERRPRRAGRQAVDAFARHAQAGRRRTAPGGRRLRRSARPTGEFATRGGRPRRSAAARCGHGRQHPW